MSKVPSLTGHSLEDVKADFGFVLAVQIDFLRFEADFLGDDIDMLGLLGGGDDDVRWNGRFQSQWKRTNSTRRSR